MEKAPKFLLLLLIFGIIAIEQISSTPRDTRHKNEKFEEMSTIPYDRAQNMERNNAMSPAYNPSDKTHKNRDKNNGMRTMGRTPLDKSYYKEKIYGTGPSEKKHEAEKPYGRSLQSNNRAHENNEKVNDQNQNDEHRGRNVGPLCRCPKLFSQVCASNGHTYNNRCMLDCLTRDMKPPVHFVESGKCRSSEGEDRARGRGKGKPKPSKSECVCNKIMSPVCGESGGKQTTYSNICLLKCAQKSDRNLKLSKGEACDGHNPWM